MTYTAAQVRAASKDPDSWWTVFLVDPLALRLTRLAANRTALTPDLLTVLSFLVGLGAAACFAHGSRYGAVLFFASFVIDCMDGKLARLTGRGSLFGGWLDYMLDRARVVCCALALAYGMGLPALGFAIIVLDLFRYLNAQQIGRTRRQMRAEILELSRPDVFSMDLALSGPLAPAPVAEVRSENTIQRIRVFLRRHRVRTHLIGGVEFQMAAFVVGPLTGLAVPLTAAAGTALVAFEVVIVHRFRKQTRAHARTLGELRHHGVPASV